MCVTFGICWTIRPIWYQGSLHFLPNTLEHCGGGHSSDKVSDVRPKSAARSYYEGGENWRTDQKGRGSLVLGRVGPATTISDSRRADVGY